MPSWLPSIPYPPPDQPGYWDPVTSTLNWCEEDYYATYYSAEIVNTLTNLLFIYLANKGLQSCLRHGHDTVFAVAYFGYFLVGFGSFMFHTTLKYPWQLVDELNMIYTTCLMAFASLSYSRTRTTQTILAIVLLALCAFITLYYHYLQDPTFHQNVYAALTAFIVFRSIYTMEITLRPRFRQQSTASSRSQSQQYINARDLQILKSQWFLVAYGLTAFLTGFGIWNVDNTYCHTLRSWRREMGLPWGIFLEGHGWWHLLTGVGAYCYIVWGVWLRHVLEGRQEEYELKWDRWWAGGLPEIVRTSSVGNGKVMNGESKKEK